MRTPAPRILALAAVAVLGGALAACSGDSTDDAAGARGRRPDRGQGHRHRLRGRQEHRVDAGTSVFAITNKAARSPSSTCTPPGDRVMGEVENIAPGLTRELHVELPAGTYETACKPGMIGKGIRGALTVTGSAAPLTDDAKLAAGHRELPALRQEPDRRAAGQDRRSSSTRSRPATSTKAKALFPVARTYWERIEPVAEIFGDLDPTIDGREDDLEDGHGVHRLPPDREGPVGRPATSRKAGPIADQLLADVKEIVAKANAEKLSPLQLANGAKELLDEVATGKITGEEDRYSHTDLWDFDANVEGSKAAVAALRPVLEERDPALVKTLDEKFADVEAALGKHRDGRRLEAAQRADPGRAEGAVRRDQRAGRADQQGRRRRRAEVGA